MTRTVERRFEPTPGAVRTAQAKTAFLAAVADRLSESDLLLLKNADAKALRRWAIQRRINAPCVRDWARGVVIAWQTLGGEHPPHCRSGFGVFMPDRGFDVLAGLDAQGLAESPLHWNEDEGRPIAANPFCEDRKAFLTRAEAHWRVRVEAVSAAGFTPVVKAPDVIEHALWLARATAGRETIGGIARSVERHRKTVTEAIDAVAVLVGLDYKRV
jgi:hypothetical protein